MLSTNETFLLLPSQLFLINDKQMRCFVSMRWRLYSHYFAVSLTELFVSLTCLNLLMYSILLVLVSARFRQIIRLIQSNVRLGSYPLSNRYSYTMVVLIKEMLLISVYILFCYIYQWCGLSSNTNYVKSINTHRWFVEA